MTTRKIQKILCPVDFSETSAGALRYASALASCWDADIVVLHAHLAQPPKYSTTAQIERLAPQGSNTQTAAERTLEEFVSKTVEKSLPRVETVVAEGMATDAILTVAAAFGANLIVMGTHGRRGLHGSTLGSVAKHVLHRSIVPVLMLRPEFAAPANGLVIREILCAANNTLVARKSLGLAAYIANCYSAMLTLLHAKEPSPEHEISDLCSCVPASERSRCRVQELTREGKAAEEVLELSAKVNCDLLVVGARHRPRSNRTVIGCTGAPIVRRANCPVLIVPGKEPERGRTDPLRLLASLQQPQEGGNHNGRSHQ